MFHRLRVPVRWPDLPGRLDRGSDRTRFRVPCATEVPPPAPDRLLRGPSDEGRRLTSNDVSSITLQRSVFGGLEDLLMLGPLHTFFHQLGTRVLALTVLLVITDLGRRKSG